MQVKSLKRKCKNLAEYLAISELQAFTKYKSDKELAAALAGRGDKESEFAQWVKEKAEWFEDYSPALKDSLAKRVAAQKKKWKKTEEADKEIP